LSQGHALTFSGNLTDSSWTTVHIFHNGYNYHIYIVVWKTTNIRKNKYVFMCEFGILSQGHALTISGNLTYLSLKKCKKIP
jgi:hypothetical protein